MDKNKSYYIATSGVVMPVEPKDGKYFSYEELKSFVGGGMVEIVPMPSGRNIVVDEEGKLTGLIKNEKATELWKKEYPIGQYSLNNDQLIVGDCLIAGIGTIE